MVLSKSILVKRSSEIKRPRKIPNCLFVFGVISGFGFGLIYLPSVITVSYYFEKKRAFATGIAVCGAGVGGFIFAPIGRMMLEVFDWKHGLYIVAGVILNAAICGMLMRPLDPPKHIKPRQKNVFDRLREKAFGRSRSLSTDTNHIVPVEEEILQGVQEAKLAREEKLREEEYLEAGSLPNLQVSSLQRLDGNNSGSVTNSLGVNNVPPSRSMSRQNSHVSGGLSDTGSPTSAATCLPLPTIVVGNDDDETKEDSANDAEYSEKAKMLKTDEDRDSNGGSKSKISTVDERKNSRGIAALPLHMRREMSGGFANKVGSLPNGALLNSASDAMLPVNGHLKSFDENMSKSFSVGNVLLSRPRKRKALPEGIQKEDYARPLYRRDIFYSGSILHIPQFRSQPSMHKYVASITTIPQAVAPEKESKLWGCLPIPKAAKDILKQMLDVSMLKDPVFLIACIAEVFGFIGLFIPFVYVAERSIELGITPTKASFLISVIGKSFCSSLII